ncbi:MAG: restriction endonuclease subunit S [Pseudomonadota bacterium]
MWAEAAFPETLVEPAARRNAKLLARDYKADGRFPVVDQGQQAIAGWTDDETLVISENLPYVVFGDHTRALKFVDFPFVLGADGTQLLKPSAEFNPLFFYFACKNLDIPNRGYNRHFALLKDSMLPKPPKPEQEKIAALLWNVQKAVEVQDKLVRTTHELKAAAMRSLFTRGLRNEPLKETEIGPAPESWEIASVSNHFRAVAGGTPSRSNPAYWTGGTIPWVKTGEIDYVVINDTEEKITAAALKDSAAKLIPAGAVLVAMYGQGVTRGKVAMLGIEATTNQACVALLPHTNEVRSDFLYAYLTFSYDRLRSLAHGGQQQNLNAELIKSFPIPKASEDEQREIARILQTLDRKIVTHEKKHATLQELFQTLLHKLMTARIRVHELDIDTSEVAG